MGRKKNPTVVCKMHWSMKDGQGLGLSAHYRTPHKKILWELTKQTIVLRTDVAQYCLTALCHLTAEQD